MSKKKRQLIEPIHKGLYAWNMLHAGSFLLFTEKQKDYYHFLFLPGPSEFCLTKEDFDECIKTNVLEFVEALPDEIYEESVKISLQCPTQTSMILANENNKTKELERISQEDRND